MLFIHLFVFFFACFLAIVSVAPTDFYFENVSQEMELIVHQVKDQENEKVLTDGKIPYIGTRSITLFSIGVVHHLNVASK